MCWYDRSPRRRVAPEVPRPDTVADRGGFLLLEAVVALAIIGLAAIATLAATAAQVRTADKAAVLLVAEGLAEDRLTSFELLGYEDLGSPPDSLLSGVFPAPFDQFAWRAGVHPTAGEYDLFQVDVVVEGRGEALPLRTLIHRPQPLIATGDGP